MSWTLRLLQRALPERDWQPTAGEDQRLPGRVLSWAGSAERELPLEAAAAQMADEVSSMGWRSRFRILDDGEPTTAQCRLHDEDGDDVPYGIGAGKGCSSVAYVGAHFEALEHAFSGPIALESLSVETRTSADMASPTWDGDRALEQARTIEEPMACLPYRPLDGGRTEMLPVCLWAPWYLDASPSTVAHRRALGDTADYSTMLSYSGNTGCAIGAGEEEALLHALNESAERDALSLFLLLTVYDGGPMPSVIDPASLPVELLALLTSVQDRLGQRVILLDLTTDLGIPVVMAYLPSQEGMTGPGYGMGASLSGMISIERAVTEVLQGELLARVVEEHSAAVAVRERRSLRPSYDRVLADHNLGHGVRSRLAKHPRLLACAQLEFAHRLAEAPIGPPPTDLAPLATSVLRQREIATDRIAASGHRVLATTLKKFDHGTVVVQVQCPGLERFHLITKGHLALPGNRARQARLVT